MHHRSRGRTPTRNPTPPPEVSSAPLSGGWAEGMSARPDKWKGSLHSPLSLSPRRGTAHTALRAIQRTLHVVGLCRPDISLARTPPPPPPPDVSPAVALQGHQDPNETGCAGSDTGHVLVANFTSTRGGGGGGQRAKKSLCIENGPQILGPLDKFHFFPGWGGGSGGGAQAAIPPPPPGQQ